MIFCLLIFFVCGCKLNQTSGNIPGGFSSLVIGSSLEGWHKSLTTHHGVSGNFFTEDGTIVLKQSPFGQGGILLTNEKYEDFELHFEFKADPGTNGGLLFRSTESGSAYQLELAGDGGKGTAALFGEMLRVEKTVPAPDLSGIWKKGDWNLFRMRVSGEVPEISLWINGKPIWQVQMEQNDLHAGSTTGFVGLQLHWSSTLVPIPGGSCCGYSWRPDAAHRYRNVYIKEL
ncbi:3-keto-disaccharide hydrolase [Cyclobacterium lianum]|uniref:3-keto-disaccharide hydrolase n=1 Tax=Cyclobacterium lianum TaxID=388280 RepID=UPI001C4A6B28|nr:DUF1080 domain-containing protein [Cyclobacterium lianum]